MNYLNKLPIYNCTDITYVPKMDNFILKNSDVSQDLSLYLKLIAENNDKQAFIKLFKHFAPRIKSYALKSGCSSNEAEDLAQETMITVWKKAKLFDSNKSAASTWVFTIGRNKRIDYLRRKKHPTPYEENLNDESDQYSHDLVLEREQTFRMIRSEINKLPVEQSEVLKKSFFEGMSHIEISDNLAIPLGTVKSRIRLALTSIRKKMKGIH